MVKFSYLSFLIVASIFSNEVMASFSTRLKGYDVLALEKREVTLKAKLVRNSLLSLYRSLKGEEVHFILKGKILGKAKTNEIGVATVKTKFFEAGLNKIVIKLAHDSRYTSQSNELRVLVTDREAPLLISDIDHTISDISGRRLFYTPNEKVPELVRASENLNLLAKDLKIVYLTAREDIFIDKTRGWLDLRGFPLGPTFYWDLTLNGRVPLNHGEYKNNKIFQLKLTHPNILIGVGDKPHDIIAYRNNGLRAYYIGTEVFELPSGAIPVKSWDGIVSHLKEFPIGSLTGDPSI